MLNYHNDTGKLVYERYTRGYGDAIMLRYAINASMRMRPKAEHHLVIFDSVAKMFSDIEGLIIHPISGNSSAEKIFNSAKIIDGLEPDKKYELSRPCADYECAVQPFVDKSRRQIFCEVVGAPYNLGSYNVRFSEEELDYADRILYGYGKCIGVHVRSAETWRDYRFYAVRHGRNRMWDLAERIAKEWGGYIVTFDHEYRYNGKLKNVVSIVDKDVRKVWATMSLMIAGIGPDSFGVHAFGSSGVPVYGMFGPTDPIIRLKYRNAFWSERWMDCQHCWYNFSKCKNGIACLNRRTTKWYWDDIRRKMGGFINV